MLRNPAYKGEAGFGKTQKGERRSRLRPMRGQPEYPRCPRSVYQIPERAISIELPKLVEQDLFAAVAEQLSEKKKRQRQRQESGQLRYLLSGLTVCKQCGYAYYGK